MFNLKTFIDFLHVFALNKLHIFYQEVYEVVLRYSTEVGLMLSNKTYEILIWLNSFFKL